MWQDFQAFILRGNVVDLAVGIVVGAAFGTIVTSFTTDVLMPPLGLLLGGADFSNFFLVLREGTPAAPYVNLAAAKAAGAVTLNYGVFVTVVLDFLIVATAVFLVIRALGKLRRREPSAPEPPATRACPYCLMTVAAAARRCAHCTSEIAPAR